MKVTKHLFVIIVALAALTTGAWAQTEAAARPAGKKKATASAATASQPGVTAADLQKLQDGLTAAQQQIQALQEELRRRDQAVQQAQTTAADAAAKAEAAQAQAKEDERTVGALQSDVAGLKSVSLTSSLSNAALKNAVMTIQEPTPAQPFAETEVYNKQMESQITIRFRGINITPGGYAAARIRAALASTGADLPTPFNSLTMPGASQSRLSEFFGSGRQSKITDFVDGRLGNVDLSSYVSADFLSAGVTSTSTRPTATPCVSARRGRKPSFRTAGVSSVARHGAW